MKKLLFVSLVLLLGLGLYTFKIEPFWLEVTQHTVTGRVTKPIKIAHLTDIHARGWSRREASVIQILMQEKPDVVVITGDSFTDSYTSQDYAMEFLKALQEIEVPLGVWAVRGNWEKWRPADNELAFYKEAKVNFLLNQSSSPVQGFWIVGLDDPWSGQADLAKALKGVPRDVFRLVLFHAPAFFDRARESFDLALSGHTHGGQVRLPFYGPLILPNDSGRFVHGWYENNGKRLYVSRGIGTSLVPMRLFCRPEVAFITVQPGA